MFIAINEELREIGNLLLAVSKKELTNEKITPEEFRKLKLAGQENLSISHSASLILTTCRKKKD
jgi:hypothetical protein